MTNQSSIEKAFNLGLLQAADYAASEKFDESVDVLQQLWATYRNEDQTGWLWNQVSYHQGNFLRMAGDLPGALEKFLAVSSHSSDLDFDLLRTYSLATTLLGLGRPQQALAEIETSLSSLQSECAGPRTGVLANLNLYADVARNIKHTVPPQHQTIFKRLIELAGGRADENVFSDPVSFAEEIASLRDLARTDRSDNKG